MRKAFNLMKVLIVIVLLAVVAIAVVKRMFPIRHSGIITRYAREYELNEPLVYSVIFTESKFVGKAVSEKGASGLMQLTKMTADWGNEELAIENYDYAKIFDPDINIRLGCWYLNKLISQYGNTDTALAAYNAGSGNVSKWLADSNCSKDGKTLYNIPFKETEQYVERARRNMQIYCVLLKINEYVKLGE